ncbi:hypothetical protein BB560_001209 [Smittium megazygosporum]|uniref:Uncharacterized protein n=1 Tax=Smittium megazygosporum TaxID=133381 RepID=A0A2T9ZI57_9FUNG|nr:hypothetical protein BB560_001209 [Smittium megazygosporum]
MSQDSICSLLRTIKFSNFNRMIVRRADLYRVYQGSVTWNVVGKIYRDKETHNSKRYIKILNRHYFGTLGQYNILVSDPISQQDNTSCHTAKETRKWVKAQNINNMSLHPQSSDINLTKDCWELHKKELIYEAFIYNKLCNDERTFKKLLNEYLDALNAHDQKQDLPADKNGSSLNTSKINQDFASASKSILLDFQSFKNNFFRNITILKNEYESQEENAKEIHLLESEISAVNKQILELQSDLEKEKMIRGQINEYDEIALKINNYDSREKLQSEIDEISADVKKLEEGEELHGKFITGLRSQFLNCYGELNKLSTVLSISKNQSLESLETMSSIIAMEKGVVNNLDFKDNDASSIAFDEIMNDTDMDQSSMFELGDTLGTRIHIGMETDSPFIKATPMHESPNFLKNKSFNNSPLQEYSKPLDHSLTDDQNSEHGIEFEKQDLDEKETNSPSVSNSPLGIDADTDVNDKDPSPRFGSDDTNEFISKTNSSNYLVQSNNTEENQGNYDLEENKQGDYDHFILSDGEIEEDD